MRSFRAEDPAGLVHRVGLDQCEAAVLIPETWDGDAVTAWNLLSFHVTLKSAQSFARNRSHLDAIVVDVVEDDTSDVEIRAQQAYSAANDAGATQICEALQACLLMIRELRATSLQRGIDFLQVWGMIVHHAKACGSKHGNTLREDLRVYHPTAERIRMEEGR